MGSVLSLVALAVKYGPLLEQLVPLVIEAGQALAPVAQKAGQAIAEHMATQAAQAAAAAPAGPAAAETSSPAPTTASADPAIDDGLAASGSGG